MLKRHLYIPASPQRVWETLTDPDAVLTWFGAEVDWDLSPGGRARFLEDDGARREGMVDEVIPQRHLRFRWWPAGQADEETSEVSYVLDPDGDGTNLTVTERQVPATPSATACASTSATWTAWDGRLLGLWSRVAAPVALGTR